MKFVFAVAVVLALVAGSQAMQISDLIMSRHMARERAEAKELATIIDCAHSKVGFETEFTFGTGPTDLIQWSSKEKEYKEYTEAVEKWKKAGSDPKTKPTKDKYTDKFIDRVCYYHYGEPFADIKWDGKLVATFKADDKCKGEIATAPFENAKDAEKLLGAAAYAVTVLFNCKDPLNTCLADLSKAEFEGKKFSAENIMSKTKNVKKAKALFDKWTIVKSLSTQVNMGMPFSIFSKGFAEDKDMAKILKPFTTRPGWKGEVKYDLAKEATAKACLGLKAKDDIKDFCLMVCSGAHFNVEAKKLVSYLSKDCKSLLPKMRWVQKDKDPKTGKRYTTPEFQGYRDEVLKEYKDFDKECVYKYGSRTGNPIPTFECGKATPTKGLVVEVRNGVQKISAPYRKLFKSMGEDKQIPNNAKDALAAAKSSFDYQDKIWKAAFKLKESAQGPAKGAKGAPLDSETVVIQQDRGADGDCKSCCVPDVPKKKSGAKCQTSKYADKKICGKFDCAKSCVYKYWSKKGFGDCKQPVKA